MEKEVVVRVRGCQYDEQEPDSNEIEVVTTGSYYLKNGNHYIIYNEMIEGFKTPTKNIIKISEDGRQVKIIKKGVINTQIFLTCGKNHQSVYATPYGELSIGTRVESMNCRFADNHILLSATYATEVNYEYVTQNLIQVDVTSKL